MKILYNNTPIFYTLKGQGPAVVFLHGFLEDSSMWQAILSCCKDKRTLAIDFPGHGKSGNYEAIYTMQEMAQVVKAVLDKHKIETATLVGHSMGGYVALSMSQHFPSYVNKLILLNSTPLPDSPERLKNRQQAIRLLNQQPERFTSLAIESLFDQESLETLSPTIKTLQSNAAKINPQGVISAVKGMMARPDSTALLARLTIPKVIIASLKDPIISARQMATLSLNAGAEFAVLPGGHMSTYEQPDRVRELMAYFLK